MTPKLKCLPNAQVKLLALSEKEASRQLQPVVRPSFGFLALNLMNCADVLLKQIRAIAVTKIHLISSILIYCLKVNPMLFVRWSPTVMV